MKKMMTNYEISSIINYASQPESLFHKSDLHMSMTCAWRLRKNMQRIGSINDLFEMERSNLMASYSTDERSFEQDGTRFVKPEYMEEYTAQMNELFNQPNEVDIDTVTFNEISPDPDHLELTYTDMEVLSFMIDDTDDDVSADKAADETDEYSL